MIGTLCLVPLLETSQAHHHQENLTLRPQRLVYSYQTHSGHYKDRTHLEMASTDHLPVLPPIETVNGTKSLDAFAQALFLLFEPVPDLLEPLYQQRPFADYDDLIAKCAVVINRLKDDNAVCCRILSAHPRLGGIAPSSQDGTTITEKLSALSRIEQQADVKNEEVDMQLALLNRAYEDKFGFKFVEFVNGRSRAELIPVFKKRLSNSAKNEMATGLDAMVDIARSRANKLLTHA